jgi:hypothetical protein
LEINAARSTAGPKRKSKSDSKGQSIPVAQDSCYTKRFECTVNPVSSMLPDGVNLINVQIIKPIDATIIDNS